MSLDNLKIESDSFLFKVIKGKIMSANNSNAWIKLYDDMVKIQYQYAGNKLRGTSRERTNVEGSQVQYPVYSGAVASPRVYRSNVNPMNPDVTTVELTMEDWEAGDYTDIFEQQKVNFDEVTELSKISAMAIGRQSDQMQIDALAASGTANLIPDGATNFTYAKALQVVEYFDENGVPPEDRFIAVSANSQTALLQEDQFINEFYTSNRLVENGSLTGKMVLGMKWIVIPDYSRNGAVFGLPKVGNIRTNFAWQQQSIGTAIGIDQNTRIDYIAEKLSWLVVTLFSANSVAIDNIGIVEIDTDETA